MPGKSPFSEEWRDCLRAHYTYVVRANDTRTLDTLAAVLKQIGFREDELREMYVRATMHVDDMPEDFTPDMTVLVAMDAAVASAVAATAAAPVSTQDDAPAQELIAAAEAAALAEELPTEDVPEQIEVDETAPELLPSLEDEPKYDPEGPQQMSLF